MRKKIFSLVLTAILALGSLSACSTESANDISYSKKGTALNTAISITLYGKYDNAEEILKGCYNVIEKYEAMLSRTRQSSDIYILNNSGEVDANDETIELLKLGLEYCKISQGGFNIAIEPLTSIWNFSADNPKVPAQKDIDYALKHLDYNKINIKGNHVSLLDKESGIDLGAIAKGYIADKVKEYLSEQNVKSALINLGGNILCLGTKPSGDSFKIGLQEPFKDRNVYSTTVDVNDSSVVSSGTYERTFTENGVSYHHILNPVTGFPYDNNLVAVTILSKESALGDVLSTTCFSLGLDKGINLIKSMDNVEAIFVTADGKTYDTRDTSDK